jgi:hypothetical protein
VRKSLSIQVLTGPPAMEGADVASVVVDNRSEIRQFLASRRARITPQQAGLPAYGGNRRVSGLRREEVALLAGVSVDYYLDAMNDAPADVRNGRRDILAGNRLGYALYSDLYIDPARPANVARFVFLRPRRRAPATDD